MRGDSEMGCKQDVPASYACGKFASCEEAIYRGIWDLDWWVPLVWVFDGRVLMVFDRYPETSPLPIAEPCCCTIFTSFEVRSPNLTPRGTTTRSLDLFPMISVCFSA